MSYKNGILTLGLVFGFGISILGPQIAYAREAENEVEDSSTKQTSLTQKISDDSKAKIQAETQKRLDEAKANAQKKIDEAKKQVQEKTEEQRQKICNEKSAQISQKISKKSANATKFLQSYTNVYDRIKQFHDNKNLVTANYDSLVASVDSKAQSAQSAVEALKSIDPTIDCTQVDAAKNKIATFTDTLNQTREALKAYRSAIKELAVAVKDSAKTTDSNSTNNEGTN